MRLFAAVKFGITVGNGDMNRTGRQTDLWQVDSCAVLGFYRASSGTTYRHHLQGSRIQKKKKNYLLFWFVSLPNNPEERTFHILRGGSLKSPCGGLYCARKWIIRFPRRCVFYSLAERLCCCAELLKCVVSLVPTVNETGWSQGQKYTQLVFRVLRCLATRLGNPPVMASQIWVTVLH